MEQQAGDSSHGRRRVLIADDDDGVCSLMQAVLGRFADVTVVYDAEAALERVERGESFDIIVSDFELPGIDGLEFVRRLRACETAARVPIVMISGHGLVDVEERARAEGANAFLGKPFTLAELRETIGSLLGDSIKHAS